MRIDSFWDARRGQRRQAIFYGDKRRCSQLFQTLPEQFGVGAGAGNGLFQALFGDQAEGLAQGVVQAGRGSMVVGVRFAPIGGVEFQVEVEAGYRRFARFDDAACPFADGDRRQAGRRAQVFWLAE